MSNRIVIELKTRAWSVSFRPFALTDRLTIGGHGADICVPGCPEGVCLLVCAAALQVELSLTGADFAGMPRNTLCFKAQEAPRLHVAHPDAGDLFDLVIHAERIPVIPDFRQRAALPVGCTVVVGADAASDIQLSHPLHTGEVLRLTRTQEGWHLQPGPGAALGVWHNTTRLDAPASLRPGDFVSALGLHLYLEEDGFLIGDDEEIRVRTLGVTGLSAAQESQHYPCLIRTTRAAVQPPQGEIPVKDPSPAPAENRGNLLLSLLPAVAMVILTVLLRSTYASSGQMVLYSALSMSIGAVTSVLTYLHTGKERRKALSRRQEEYTRYIADCEERIRSARTSERFALRRLYITPEEELQHAADFSAALYDRRPGDADFLDVRLGYGTLRSRQVVTCPEHDVHQADDPLFALPGQLRDRYAFLSDLPAVLHGASAGAAGVIGDLRQLRSMLHVAALDLAVRHSDSDVRLCLLMSEKYMDEIYALRLLPHLRDRESGRRSIACDAESRTTLLEELYTQLAGREADLDAAKAAPWLVIFADADDAALMRHPLIRFVPGASALHVLFVFMASRRDLLPQGCTMLVRLMSNTPRALLSTLSGDAPDQLFTCCSVRPEDVSAAAARLAPVYTGEMNLASHLTGNESLFDMLGLRHAGEMDVLGAWRRADASRSLSAPLGIRDDGEVLELDLHESAHGPHGLVAGMTGSGKSQVLISYVLSLATRYSPEDVTFAVIDFKGGDVVKQLPGLPHIVGSITNLEKDEIERSLRSLNAEKNRRMVLFDEDHANVSNISEYTRAYRAGRVATPLPHLVIIVDEFAELKNQYGDFMQDLISIARVGRSLGIHLILCTQKPGGIVDGQIWSNSNFHLCLKVQNREDSNDVLRSPLAAEIRERGRGYLQVEQQLFDLFQSGYSGHPEMVGSEEDRPFSIRQLDLAGRSVLFHKHTPEACANSRTQREAVLAQVLQAFAASGMAMPQPLCLPALPQLLPYEPVASVPGYLMPVGLLDDPDAQAIHPLTIDVSGCNTLVLGGSQMGKTNLLLTLVRRMSEHFGPQQAAIYAMDFNAKALKALEGLQLMGGVVMDDEDEKLLSLMRLLRQIIAERKERFSRERVTTFRTYRQLHDDLPAVVVLIDNYAMFHELYEERLGDELLYLLREGPAYGMSFVVTLQQSASLGYKKPHYFTHRLVLPVSDRSEYLTLLEGCRRTLRDIRGRVLVQHGREVLEGQICLAFPGRTEQRRLEEQRRFLQEHSGAPRARPIPSVPDVLTLRFLRDQYPDAFRPGCFPVAMAYPTVSPVGVDATRGGCLTLVGGTEEQRTGLVNLLLGQMATAFHRDGGQIYILDGYTRPLKRFRGHPAVPFHGSTAEDVEDFFARMSVLTQQRSQLSPEEAASMAPVVIVLNSADLLGDISENMLQMQQMRTLLDSRRRYGLFFLFTDVPNRPVRFSSPELLRLLTDEKHSILLGELSAIEFYDVPILVQRANNRAPTKDEAFLFNGDDVVRIKLCVR